MWQVDNNECLQFMSDSIVNATHMYIQQDQPVPSWVYNLTQPLQAEKIELVKVYGSPNVFSQFQPHVTLATDSKTPQQLFDVVSAMNISSCAFSTFMVGIGRTGPFGTVLRSGGDLADYNITK